MIPLFTTWEDQSLTVPSGLTPVVWLLCLRHKWIRVWLSQIDWYQLYDCFVYDDPSLRWAIIVVVIWLSCGRDIAKYNPFRLAQMASYISISSCNGHHRSELCTVFRSPSSYAYYLSCATGPPHPEVQQLLPGATFQKVLGYKRYPALQEIPCHIQVKNG